MCLVLSTIPYLQVISMHSVNHLYIISNHFLTFIYLFNFKPNNHLILILAQIFYFLFQIFLIIVRIFWLLAQITIIIAQIFSIKIHLSFHSYFFKFRQYALNLR